MTDPVFFRILGPLHAGVQDRTVELEDGRARLVLAALLLEALETDSPVATDRLVQAVWDGRPPTSARTQVAMAVSTLRRAFRRAGCGLAVIETFPPGYRIAAGTIDARAAERNIAWARAAATTGRYEEAAQRYRAALSLWDGPVLAGLQSSLVVAGALRWERLQLAVTEEAAEVELLLGRHHALVSELTRWVTEYPFHERLRVLLMMALVGAGRQREALEVYSDGRRALREGLDLDPGRELQCLYESILLDGAWRQGPPPSAAPPIGMPLNDVPSDGVAPKGVSPEAVRPDAAASEGVAPEGLPPEAVRPDAVPPEGVVPKKISPDGVAARGVPPKDVGARGVPPRGRVSPSNTSKPPRPPAGKASKPGKASKANPNGRYCAGAVPRTNRWRDTRGRKRPYGPPGEHPSGR